MTRARERLVLSGGVNLKSNRSRTYLQRLLQAWDLSLEGLPYGEIQLDETTITARKLDRVTITEEASHPVGEHLNLRVNATEFAKVWKERAAVRKVVEETPVIRTPSQVERR